MKTTKCSSSKTHIGERYRHQLGPQCHQCLWSGSVTQHLLMNQSGSFISETFCYLLQSMQSMESQIVDHSFHFLSFTKCPLPLTQISHFGKVRRKQTLDSLSLSRAWFLPESDRGNNNNFGFNFRYEHF